MIRRKLGSFGRSSGREAFDFTKPSHIYAEVEGVVTHSELDCADGITHYTFFVGEEKFEMHEGYSDHMIPVLRCGDYVILHMDQWVRGIQILDSMKTNVILAVTFNHASYKTNNTVYSLNKFIA